MNVLESLTDAGLKRLYKFVLKRSIGRYLQDHLRLDQLTVSSRSGEVTISDLAVNCQVINEKFLADQPFRFASITIGKLDAKISYSLLCGDGCTFTVKGVSVVLEPNSNQSKGRQNNLSQPSDTPRYPTKHTSIGVDSDKASAPTDTGTDNEGIQFIAHWIEVIMSSIKLVVNDITIVITGPSTSKHSLSITIGKIGLESYNPHLNGGNVESSVVRTKKIIFNRSHQTASASSVVSGERKVIHLNDFKFNIEDKHGLTAILACEKKITLQYYDSSVATASLNEIDVTVPDVICKINSSTCLAVLEIIIPYLTAAATIQSVATTVKQHPISHEEALSKLILADPHLGAILQLEKAKKDQMKREIAYDFTSDDTNKLLDFDKIVDYLKHYHIDRRKNELGVTNNAETRHSSDLLSKTLHNNNTTDVNDDDINFSDSDGDNDDEFVDAIEMNVTASILKSNQIGSTTTVHTNKSMKRVNFESQHSFPETSDLEKSAYGYDSLHSSAFKSAYGGKSIGIVYAPKLMTELKKQLIFRIHLDSAKVMFASEQEDERELQLSLEEVQVTMNSTDITDTSGNKPNESKSQASFSAGKCSVDELTLQSSYISLGSFYSPHNIPGVIKHPPHVFFELVKECNRVTISIELQPIIVSIHIEIVSYWTDIFHRLMASPQVSLFMANQESSSSEVSLSLKLGELEFFIHSHPEISNTRWEELEIAANLNYNSDRWEPLLVSSTPDFQQSHFFKHLNCTTSKGGIRLYFRNISLKYSNDPTADQNTQALTMDEFSAFIYFNRTLINPNIVEHYLSHNLHRPKTPLGNDKLGHEEICFWESRILQALCESTVGDRNKVKISKSSSRRSKHSKPFAMEMSSSNINIFSTTENKGNHRPLDVEEGRGLYDDDGGIPKPSINDDNIIQISAHTINIGVRQREYCTLITIADTFSVPCTTQAASTASENSKPSSDSDNDTGGGFSIVLISNLAIISVSKNSLDDDATSLYAYQAAASSTPPRDLAANNDFSLTISVIKPMIQVIMTSCPVRNTLETMKDTFFSIQAEDMSMFDMSIYQSEKLREEFLREYSVHKSPPRQGIPKDNSTSIPSCRGARIGSNARYIPILHRTTLHEKSGVWDLDNGNQRGPKDLSASTYYDHTKSKHTLDHTFRLQVLLKSLYAPGVSAAKKNTMTFDMSLQDVTMRYDPSSTWLMNIVALLTPLSCSQVIDRRVDRLRTRSDINAQVPDQVTEPSSYCGCIGATRTEEPSASTKPYEITRVHVRVRKCLVDYCCVQSSSRLLFSLGMLSMSTTIVSNSIRYGLKFTIRDIALHISNQLASANLSSEYEQSPIDPLGRCMCETADVIDMDKFIDAHAFVQLMTLDYMDSMIVINDSNAPLSLQINLGNCCIYACLDSLDILTDTMLSWWIDFKAMMESAQEIIASSSSATPASMTPAVDPRTSTLQIQPPSRSITTNSSHWMASIEENAFAPVIKEGPPSQVVQADKSRANSEAPPVKNAKKDQNISGFIIEDYYAQPSRPTSMEDTEIAVLRISDKAPSPPEYEVRWIADYGDDCDDNDNNDDLDADNESQEDFIAVTERNSNSAAFGDNSCLTENSDEDEDEEERTDYRKYVNSASKDIELHNVQSFQQSENQFAVDDSSMNFESDEECHHSIEGVPVSTVVMGSSLYGKEMMLAQSILLDDIVFDPSEYEEDEDLEEDILLSSSFRNISSMGVRPKENKTKDSDYRESDETLVDFKDFDDHDGHNNRSRFLSEEEIKVIETASEFNIFKSLQDTSTSAIQVPASATAPATAKDLNYFTPSSSVAFILKSEMNRLKEHDYELNVFKFSCSDAEAASMQSMEAQQIDQYSNSLADHALKINIDNSSVSFQKPGAHLNEAIAMAPNEDIQLYLAATTIESTTIDPIKEPQNDNLATISPPLPEQLQQSTKDDDIVSSEIFRDELDDFAMAWAGFDDTGNSNLMGSFSDEERARWYIDPLQIHLDHYYIPIAAPRVNEDCLPDLEKELPISIVIKIKASVRLKLFGGFDWSSSDSIYGSRSTSASVDRRPNNNNNNNNKNINSTSKRKVSPHLAALLEPSSIGESGRTSQNDYSNHNKARSSTSSSSLSKRALFERPAIKHQLGSTVNRRQTVFALNTRDQDDMLDVFLSEISSSIRIYDNKLSTLGFNERQRLPCQRISFQAMDLIVSHAKAGERKKKIFGWWRTHKQPRGPHTPMLHATMVGYDSISDVKRNATFTAVEDTLEHRVAVNILPLRCYLDPFVIQFLQELGRVQDRIDKSKFTSISSNDFEATPSTNAAAATAGSRNILYFQMIRIGEFDIKIDYQPNMIDLQALHQGDYVQLLNIIPLEGLELTLKKNRLTGVSGFGELFDQAARTWIEDIYQHQMHRVISGTTPFKGIANVGASLQDLLMIPMNDYKRNRYMVRDVQRKTSKFVRTVARETLHATAGISKIVAMGIHELTSDSSNTGRMQQQQFQLQRRINQSRRLGMNQSVTYSQPLRVAKISRGNPTGISDGLGGKTYRQPTNVEDGLQRAYETFTREVGVALDSVVNEPIRQYQRTGSSKGYIQDVVMAIPTAILRPVAGAAEGLSETLMGLRNTIDPQQQVDEEDMWNVQ